MSIHIYDDDREETGVQLVGDYNSPYLFVREEIVHDIRWRGGGHENKQRTRLAMNSKFFFYSNTRGDS